MKKLYSFLYSILPLLWTGFFSLSLVVSFFKILSLEEAHSGYGLMMFLSAIAVAGGSFIIAFVHESSRDAD